MSSLARAILLTLGAVSLVNSPAPVVSAQQSSDDLIETNALSDQETLNLIKYRIIDDGFASVYECREQLAPLPVELSTAMLLELLADKAIEQEARKEAWIYSLLYLLEFDETSLADDVIRAAAKGMDAEETSIKINALNILGKPNSANLDLAIETLIKIVKRFGPNSRDGTQALGALSSRVLPRHRAYSPYFLSVFEETIHPIEVRGYAIQAFTKVAPIERTLDILEKSKLPGQIAALSAITPDFPYRNVNIRGRIFV